MDDDPRSRLSPDDLVIPFIFVPHGAPDPVEWKAAHPEWVKFPATFVPRRTLEVEEVDSAPPDPLPPPLPWRPFPGSASAGSPPTPLLPSAAAPDPLSFAAGYGIGGGGATLAPAFWDQVRAAMAALFGAPDARAQTPDIPDEAPENTLLNRNNPYMTLEGDGK